MLDIDMKKMMVDEFVLKQMHFEIWVMGDLLRHLESQSISKRSGVGYLPLHTWL